MKIRKNVNIEIISAFVLLTDGADIVYLETKFPCPFVKEALPSQPKLSIQFCATYDTGIDYVRNNFGIEPGVRNTRS